MFTISKLANGNVLVSSKEEKTMLPASQTQVTISKGPDIVEFSFGGKKLAIEYSKISSPASDDIDDLFEDLTTNFFFKPLTLGSFEIDGEPEENGDTPVFSEALQKFQFSPFAIPSGTAMGVATPTTNPGTPSETVWYFATTPGTYTNFSNIEVSDEEIAILSNATGSWAKTVISSPYVDVTKQIQFVKGNYLINGTLSISASWYLSNYISVHENGNYWLSLTAQAGTYSLFTYYDYEKKYISAVAGGSATHTRLKLTIPSTACYVRIVVYNTQIGTFKFETDIYSVLKTAIVKDFNNRHFIVPTYYDAVIDHEFNLFLDSITMKNKYEVDFTTIVSSATGVTRRQNMLQYKPTTTASNKTITFTKVDSIGSKEIGAKATLRTVARTGGSGTKNVMLVGDSLTENTTLATTVYSLLAADGDVTINDLGTYGSAGSRNEGRGGWSWSNYVNDATYSGKTNSFLYSGLLNFTQYCVDRGYSGIDYVLINLGTNDITQGKSIPTQTAIDAIIANAKTFIDALVRDFPSVKIAIALPSMGGPIADLTDRNAITFKYSMALLSKNYLTNFDNGAYKAGLTCFSLGSWLDVVNSYPYTIEAVSARVSDTIRVYSDFIHPLTIGFQQFGDAYYAKIRSWIAGNL